MNNTSLIADLYLKSIHTDISYNKFQDIDIYVGGLAEEPPLAKGPQARRQRRTAAVLGTTHGWIVADAFAKLRRADRYN